MNEQSKTTIERARALLAKADWYAYDPDDGIGWHGTDAEAKADALAALESFRDASPDGWHEDVGSVQWGLLIPFEQVEETDRVETPDAEFDYLCDYAMKPHPLGEVFATLCDEADASERRAVEAEAGAAAMRGMLADLRYYVDGSDGVAGWHLSGATASWGETGLTVDAIDAALANPAGRAILDRLERAEAIAVSMAHEVDAILADARDTEDGLLRQFDDLRRRSRDEARVALMRIGELEAEHNAYHTAAENAYAAQLAAESERDALRAERDQLRKDWDNALSVSTAHFQSEIRALKAELEKEQAKVRRLEGLKARMCACYDPDGYGCVICGGSGVVMVEDGK